MDALDLVLIAVVMMCVYFVMELPNVTNVEESILINIKYLNMTHYTDNNQKQHKEQLEEALKKNKGCSSGCLGMMATIATIAVACFVLIIKLLTI